MADTAQQSIGALEKRLALEPQSPLFARLASLYVGAGRAQDALRLCDDGLAHYPFYATAHLVKGRALSVLGMMAEARHEYEVVLELLPMSEAVARLVSSIDVGTPTEHATSHAAIDVLEEPPARSVIDQPAEEQIESTAAEETPRPAVEEIVQSSAAASEESMVTEEPVQETEAPVEDEAAQEVTAEEPLPVADNLAGFGETATEEPMPSEPSAAEKLGLEMKQDTMMPLTDAGFGAGFEDAPPAPEEPATDLAPQGAETGESEPETGGAFGITEQVVEEQTVSAAPTEEPPAEVDPLAEYAPRTDAQDTAESSVGAVAAEPAAAESENPDWLDAFSQLQQPPAEAERTTPAAASSEEENPFAMFGSEEPAATTEGEQYEEYTARVRMELFGNENKMTLEEYLGQQAATGSAGPAADDISELAERLKSSPRLTPPVINFSEKASRSSSDAEAAGGSGFVTPTLAEIYVKQGWFDDAIKAYRSLAANKPAERGKFEQRISEIEEMKKSQ